MSHAQETLDQALQFHRAGRVREALDLYAKILPQHQNNAQLLYLVGTAYLDTGQHQQGLDLLARSLAFDPKNPPVHMNHGLALAHLGRLEEALASFGRALALNPSLVEAHENRGIALLNLKRPEEALAAFEQALTLRPDHAKAHSNRGNALKDLGRLEEAVASYDRALDLSPDYAAAHNDRGNALKDLGRLEEAVASYDRALDLMPAHAEVHSNRGNALKAFGRLEEAVASYDRALALMPGHADAHWNKAVLRLLTGQYPEGWELYEWRLETAAYKDQHYHFPQPAWRGQPGIAGKRILIYGEQGLGDTIQFCRYLPQIAALGAEIILEAQKPLISLISTLDCPMTVIAKGEPLPEFDAYCPIMSLPHAFKTTVDTIPAQTPYLHADEGKARQWRRQLGATKRLRVGLVWSGAAMHQNDAQRSIRLQDLLPLTGLPVEWHSLHKEYRPHDLECLGHHPEIHQHQHDLHDFSDTSALIDGLDLVITVDTSVAHVAGALGKPVWILLPFVPDYRWLLGRQDSPWYPTARLFRQPALGDWQSVIAEVAATLHALHPAGARG